MPFRSSSCRVALAAAGLLTSFGCSSAPTASNETPTPEAGAGADAGTDAGFVGQDDSGSDAMGPAPFDAGPLSLVDAQPISDGGRRAIDPVVLARHALCYSGYRANEDPTADPPTYPTEAEVTQDLQLLVQGGWTLLRLFDCGPHASVTLKAIRDGNFDFKVMQGVSISGPAAQFDAANQSEIGNCLALNAAYSDIIVAFSVGNETLDAWSDILTPPADLAGYITEVRGKVSQPVTTDDFFPPFEFGMDSLPNGQPYSYAGVAAVVQAADFLAIHVYPFLDAPYGSWDYQQTAVDAGPARAVAMMAAAETYTETSIATLRQTLSTNGFDVPIVIGETGWKSTPDPNTYEVSLAHPVNQQMFHDTEMAWVYGANKNANSPLAAFYFEGFDEPWKTTDDGWGLFDTNRYAKYVLWGQFPNLKAPGSPSYTQADAVYFKPGDPTNPPP